jgi:hypothetical protein
MLSFSFVQTATHTGTEAFRIQLGKSRTANTLGRLTVAGVGVECSSNFLYLLAHNGTTLTVLSCGGASLSRNRCVILKCGTVLQLYVNDALVGTISGTTVPSVTNTDAGLVIENTNGNVSAERGMLLNRQIQIYAP